MRDPNERMLMSNLVTDSPMFDFVEQMSGRPIQNVFKKKSKEQIQLEQAERELEMQADELKAGIERQKS